MGTMIVSYGPDDGGMFARTSGKRLAILFGVVLFGALMLIQMMFGFPLKSIFFNESATKEVKVISKIGGQCTVEIDSNPRNIENCPYNQGDKVDVTYSTNNMKIQSHHPAG